MTFTISYLWSHPQISGGAPMVRGSRVTLEVLHGLIKAGDTLKDTCEDMGIPLENAKKAYAEWFNASAK